MPRFTITVLRPVECIRSIPTVWVPFVSIVPKPQHKGGGLSYKRDWTAPSISTAAGSKNRSNRFLNHASRSHICPCVLPLKFKFKLKFILSLNKKMSTRVINSNPRESNCCPSFVRIARTIIGLLWVRVTTQYNEAKNVDTSFL